MTYGTADSTERAYQEFQKAYTKDSTFAEAYTEAGMALRWLNNNGNLKDYTHEFVVAKIDSLITNALIYDPDYAKTYMLRAELKYWMDNSDEDYDEISARDDYLKSIELNPNGTHTLSNYGGFLRSLDQLFEAIEIHELLYSIDPKNPRSLWALHRSYYAAGEYEKSKGLLDELIALHPDSHFAYWTEVEYYQFIEGRFDSAHLSLTSLMQKDPNSINSYYRIHENLLNMNESEKAKEWEQKIRDIARNTNQEQHLWGLDFVNLLF